MALQPAFFIPVNRPEFDRAAIALLLRFPDRQGEPVLGFLGERTWRNSLPVLRVPGIVKIVTKPAERIGSVPGPHGLLDGFRLFGAPHVGQTAFGKGFTGAARAGHVVRVRVFGHILVVSASHPRWREP